MTEQQGRPRDTKTLKTLLRAAFEERNEGAAIETAEELGPHLEYRSHGIRPPGNNTMRVSVTWLDTSGDGEEIMESDWDLPAALRVSEGLGFAPETITEAVEAHLKRLDARGEFEHMAETLTFLTKNPRFGIVQRDLQHAIATIAYRGIRTFRLKRVYPTMIEAWLDAAMKETEQRRQHHGEPVLFDRTES